MFSRMITLVVMAALCLLAIDVRPARSDEPEQKAPTEAASTQEARQSIERGLAFLEKDALAWRKEHQCATCHHGTMTVWVLSEAKSRGYAVKPETLADVTDWTKERLKGIDKPRDTRPGWSMVNTPALYLAMMAQAVPKQEAVSADELRRIAGHLVRHQEADGSWAWSSAPPGNRPPPHFESDEVATLLGYMALGPQVPADSEGPSEARESRRKRPRGWGRANPPTPRKRPACGCSSRSARASRRRRSGRRSIDSWDARTRMAAGASSGTCPAMPTPPARRSMCSARPGCRPSGRRSDEAWTSWSRASVRMGPGR